jgi:hypothetical protein
MTKHSGTTQSESDRIRGGVKQRGYCSCGFETFAFGTKQEAKARLDEHAKKSGAK